jgi:hypothetical protein
MSDVEVTSDIGERLPYEPPSAVVLGTVQELTRAGVTGQSDGLGFEEIGGS